MTKIETLSGVSALAGIGLLVSSNYVKKTGADADKRIKNMRIVGFSLLVVALVGMGATKTKLA